MYSTELTTEHVFENFRGDCLVAGSASKTCQYHLETRAVNVWDLAQSHQQNPATQTGQLSWPASWHDNGQTY